MTDDERLLASERVQQSLIAVSGATRFMSGILMGTAMAVYVGRSGSEFAVSMVLTAYFLGMTVFAPFWGAVADVTGRRRAVMVATGLLATLAVLPLTVVDGVWGPIGLRALYAVFAVGFGPVMLAIVSERGGAEGRGQSLGFYNSARGAGFAGGQLVVGVLLGLLVPASLYLVIAAVSLLSTAAAALVADPTPSTDRDPDAGEVLAEVRRRLLPAVDDREHLRTNGLWVLYVALALRNMTVLGVMSLMPVYLTRDVLFAEVVLAGVALPPETVMGALLAINPAGQTVFMYLFGRIADAAGRKPLIVVGMAGSGLFAVVEAVATVPGGLLARTLVAGAGLVVIAAAFSAMTTGALAFIGDVAPAARESELMGLRSTAKGVGGVLGPPIIGGVATVAGIEAAFAVGSTLAVLAAGLAFAGLVESGPVAPDPSPAPGDD
ncbi:MFS transporter [Halobacteriales archaeon QS_8_69_26]|nr:MAG: MFS transporter [Halobacteriales archaeon QS_8_69_26]